MTPIRLMMTVLGFLMAGGIACADQVNSDYEDLRARLVNDDVMSLDITHIPYSYIFSERITPAQISGWTGYRCTIDVTPEINKSLLAAVNDAHFVSIDGDWDMRWAVAIKIKGRTNPTMIYLNGRTFIGAGQRGMLNGAPMALTRSLSIWLERSAGKYCPDLKI
jgi:hypothetical protein